MGGSAVAVGGTALSVAGTALALAVGRAVSVGGRGVTVEVATARGRGVAVAGRVAVTTGLALADGAAGRGVALLAAATCAALGEAGGVGSTALCDVQAVRSRSRNMRKSLALFMRLGSCTGCEGVGVCG